MGKGRCFGLVGMCTQGRFRMIRRMEREKRSFQKLKVFWWRNGRFSFFVVFCFLFSFSHLPQLFPQHGKPNGKGTLKVQGTGNFAVEWSKGKIVEIRETKKG